MLNDGVNRYLYDAEGRISTPATKDPSPGTPVCAVASTPVAGITTMTGYI